MPGVHGNQPLDDAQAGWVLLGELGCMACHEGDAASVLGSKGAPDLSQVGGRVSPDYLRRFIAEPTKVQPGVTMPDLLAGKTATERAAMAEAITHFLVGKADGRFAEGNSVKGNPNAGRALYHEIGCIACHNPRDDQAKELPSPGLLSLAHVQQKYGQASLAEFLFNPHQVRASGRMPDFQLSQKEAQDLSSYLMGSNVQPSKS